MADDKLAAAQYQVASVDIVHNRDIMLLWAGVFSDGDFIQMRCSRGTASNFFPYVAFVVRVAMSGLKT
jgi:hypothetical protein